MDYTIAWACVAAFLAGFVDSIAGGGGLVQTPVLFLLFPQFSAQSVIATNRFASFAGTALAAYKYSQKVKITWKIVLFAAAGAILFSYLGAFILIKLPGEVIKPTVVVCMIFIAFFTYLKKDLGHVENLRFQTKHMPIAGLILGSAIGFYNGMIGPGTGSLLVFGFVAVLGFSFLEGSAMAKYINFLADMSSLVVLIHGGFVAFQIAIPMMFANMAGAWVGSKTALNKGNSFIRKFFLLVILILIIRLLYDIYSK